MNNLDVIGDFIRTDFEEEHTRREAAIKLSRSLTRQCANTIRAIHRGEWAICDEKLQQIRTDAEEITNLLSNQPALYYAGYTQDALKEYVEAFLTYALVRNTPLPLPQELGVISSTYINGLCEAASELRRQILDIIRHDNQHDEAERMLQAMDQIYTLLITIDFPDAITGGLRRRTDQLRGVLERTRGELTMSLRQKALQNALDDMKKQLSV